jgi:hypothetical protein
VSSQFSSFISYLLLILSCSMATFSFITLVKMSSLSKCKYWRQWSSTLCFYMTDTRTSML